MAFIDVDSWTAENIVVWLRGLHSSLETAHLDEIVRRKTTGAKMLMNSPLDLIDLIPDLNAEAYEAVRNGIELLHNMARVSRRETLQSMTLNLGCLTKHLLHILIEGERSPRILPVSGTSSITPMTGASKSRFDFAKVDSNMQINRSTKQRVSLETLDCVSMVVDQIIRIIEWMNCAEMTSELNKSSKDFKCIVLRVAIELTSTAQRDQFVEQPNDVLSETARFFADYCDWVVLVMYEPEFIEPCWLDVVSVKLKEGEEDFGMMWNMTNKNYLVIDEVAFSSAAHRSTRISKGDEVVQVDYTTVIGWPPGLVMDCINYYNQLGEITLTLRRKPLQLTSYCHLSPHPLPSRLTMPRAMLANQVVPIEPDKSELVVENSAVLERQASFVVEPVEEPKKEEEQKQEEEVIGVAAAGAPAAAAVAATSEPSKESKAHVYATLQATRSRQELRRRTSVSGEICDWWFESVADTIPIRSLEDDIPITPVVTEPPDATKLRSITKEAITKSNSHDTAKLYLHLRSLDRDI